MSQQPAQATPLDAQWRCWSAHKRITLVLLAAWVAASFGVAWWAPMLSEWTFLGWPLGFYMAAQGSPFLFIVLVAVYARACAEVERRHGLAEVQD